MSWPCSIDVRLRVAEDPEPVRLRVDEVIVAGGAPPYGGAYEVTPQPYADVVLPTRDKLMLNDVTVLEIPYYTTTNDKGGYTAIIGG